MTIQEQAPAHGAADGSATLTFEGRPTDFPIRRGTIGPAVMDIARLHKDTGCFSYDPGFTSTANCA